MDHGCQWCPNTFSLEECEHPTQDWGQVQDTKTKASQREQRQNVLTLTYDTTFFNYSALLNMGVLMRSQCGDSPFSSQIPLLTKERI